MEEDSQTSRRTSQDRQNESTNDLSSTAADDTTDTDDDDDTIVERPGVRYPLRRNKSERNRIKLEHELYRHVWQGNYSAPVDSILLQDGAKVLDIGCGTGVWIEDMFSKFPSAQFTGIDVFPVSFRTNSPNLTFIEHNVIDGLPFEDNHFDYVHCRHCLFAFSPDEWVEIVIPEIIRVTKPLGFIEHCEIDGNFINEGPLLKKLTNAVRELITNRGIDCAMGENLDQALIQTKALYKVHHQHKYSPVGGDSWGGDYGQKAFDSFSRIVLALQHDVSAMIDVAISDFNSFTSKCAEEAKSHRTYFKSHRIFAQKRSTDS